VQISEPVIVGLMNEHRIRIRNIDAAFDDRRADQHVRFTSHKAQHSRFEFGRSHLPVSDVVTSFRDNLFQPCGNFMNVVDTVMNEEDLTVPVQFAHNRLPDQVRIEAANPSGHGDTLLRRRGQV